MSENTAFPSQGARALRDARHEIADALKALALLGVFLINGVGYLASPGHPLPLGPAQPFDSPIAIAVHALVFSLCMGKAWPLLVFLFGHSLQLMAMRLRRFCDAVQTKRALKRRYAKLLLLGVLHGVLVYFGDVLTAYALCGVLALRWIGLGMRKLARVLRRWLYFALISSALMLVLLALSFIGGDSGDARGGASFASMTNRAVWWWLNFEHYLLIQGTLLLMMPKLLCLVLAGMMCAKLRLLQPHRRISRRVWQHPLWGTMFVLGAMLQLVTTVATEYLLLSHPLQHSLDLFWSTSINELAGLTWAAGAFGCLMRALGERPLTAGHPTWLRWLAPAGRYTLVMYLGLSLSLVALAPAWGGSWFAAAGVSHPLGNSWVATLLLIAMWAIAVRISHSAAQRGWRDPLAQWLSASTKSPNLSLRQ